MADKLMYTSPMMICKITHSVDFNKWLKRLNTQLNERTNQNSQNVTKVVKSTIKKRDFKTLGTSKIIVHFPLSLSD